MKLFNVKIWLWAFSVLTILGNLVGILSPESAAKTGWGDAITAHELHIASTYEGGFGISTIGFGLMGLLIIFLTKGGTQAKFTLGIALVGSVTQFPMFAYFGAGDYVVPAIYPAIFAVLFALMAISGWLHRRD
jgi:hypothetical protein